MYNSSSARRLVAVPLTPQALTLVEQEAASIVLPNVRAKLAPTVGRAGPVGENVHRTADRARVARRWGSA